MSSLQQRILAAAVLIPLVVAGVLWLPSAGFAGMLAAFVLVAAHEWGCVGELPPSWRVPFIIVLALSMAAGYALADQRAVAAHRVAVVPLVVADHPVVAVVEWVVERYRRISLYSCIMKS